MQFKIYLNRHIIIAFFAIIFNFNNLYAIENKIKFKVDNEIITSLDIDNEIRYLKALNPSFKDLDKNKIYLIGKNSIIREKIKKNELLKYTNNFDIDKKYLDKLIKSRYLGLNLKNKESFLEYLKKQQIDIQMIENKISIEAIWNELIYSKFFSKVKIDRDKLKIIIQENNSKNIKSYLLSELLFNISNRDELEKKHEKIKNEISKNGFENAVLTYSISDSSNMGGKLGWIREDSLNNEIKEVLSKLKINDITKPIITQNGFLLIKIDDLLENLINIKTNQQLNQFSINYFNKIKKDISINEL
jgi:peptidyl-prolyl cis-trans isomerase SurA